tara:strand:- start:169 stop:342 length:174 start_codon:yes stop_codon:yes gene_type:complete
MPPDRCTALTPEELEELNALRKAITEHPASVHSDKMERFADLMVRCLDAEEDKSSDK